MVQKIKILFTKLFTSVTGKIIGGIAFLGFMVLVYQTAIAVHVGYEQANQFVTSPFLVHLNAAVSNIKTDAIVISPRIDGKWSLKHDGFGNKTLAFTATGGFKPGVKYTVSNLEIQHLVGGSGQLDPIHFSTVVAPQILDEGLMKLTDNSTIAPNTDFTVKLAKPNTGIRNFQFSTTPNIPMTFSAVNDTTFTWHANPSLPPGQTVHIKLYDARSREIIVDKQVIIASPLTVASFNKPTDFVQGDVAQITFNKPIAEGDVSKIHFDVPGSGSLTSPTVYTYTPTTVQPGQTYHYTIDSGTHSTDGGVTTQTITGSFSTFGHVTITQTSPSGARLNQASQTISFTFNHEVDHTSAANHFSVSSGTVASQYWQGNTFIATVINLGYQQTITATMTAGVAPVGFALPTDQTYRVTFQTARQMGVDVQMAYAAAHWNDQNNATYGNFDNQGGDCANFVSQTLIARGWDMNNAWYNYGPTNWTETWGYVPTMDAYLSSHASAFGLQRLTNNQRSQFAVGDIIVLSWEGTPDATSQQDHTEIISQIINNNGQISIKAASHNNYGMYRDLDDQITNVNPGGTYHVWHLTRDTNY